MVKPRILVVAGDTQLRATLARWLMAAGYGVEVAENLRRAHEASADGGVALAIVALDGLGAPDAAGELAGKVRQVITIAGATVGAKTPGGLDETALVSRVRSALGPLTVEAPRGGAEVLRFEGYTLDAGGRTCRDARGQDVTLTRAEFSLLLALARSPGRVLSRDELSQAAAGRGTEPDDRSVDVLISRLRRKIEPDPKAPRIIVTMPGEGYKLAVPAQVVAPAAAASASLVPGVAAPDDPTARVPDATVEAAPPPAVQGVQVTTSAEPIAPTIASPGVAAPSAADRGASTGPSRKIAIGAAIVLVGGIAALLLVRWNSSTQPDGRTAASIRAFDAKAVPLVADLVREQLAGYPRAPGAKAIAISREGWGLSTGTANEEAAGKEALDRCRERDKRGFCRLYAVGDRVVWDSATLPVPLPADIRLDDMSSMPMVTPEEMSRTWQAIWQRSPPPFVSEYLRGEPHRALAVSLTSRYREVRRKSREEAIRLAIERCSDLARSPCLLLSVDGVWTVQVPRSYRVLGPFTLAGEADMSTAERTRMATIYAGKDWRALAKDRSGRWYAVAGRPTEAAAIEDVLKACGAQETPCSLHAIGNWRVGEKLDDRR